MLTHGTRQECEPPHGGFFIYDSEFLETAEQLLLHYERAKEVSKSARNALLSCSGPEQILEDRAQLTDYVRQVSAPYVERRAVQHTFLGKLAAEGSDEAETEKIRKQTKSYLDKLYNGSDILRPDKVTYYGVFVVMNLIGIRIPTGLEDDEVDPRVRNRVVHLQRLSELAGLEGDAATLVMRRGERARDSLLQHMHDNNLDDVMLAERQYTKMPNPYNQDELLVAQDGHAQKRVVFADFVLPAGFDGRRNAGLKDYIDLLNDAMQAG